MARIPAAILLCLAMPGCMIVQVSATNPVPGLSTVAVAPFFNLSQEKAVDGRRFAMAYFAELQKTSGFEVVPVGITEQAIFDNKLQMDKPDDVLELARILNVDAVVIGAVTDYDPYYPPRIGLKIAWYSPKQWRLSPGDWAIPTTPFWRRSVFDFLNGFHNNCSVCEGTASESCIRSQSPRPENSLGEWTSATGLAPSDKTDVNAATFPFETNDEQNIVDDDQFWDEANFWDMPSRSTPNASIRQNTSEDDRILKDWQPVHAPRLLVPLAKVFSQFTQSSRPEPDKQGADDNRRHVLASGQNWNEKTAGTHRDVESGTDWQFDGSVVSSQTRPVPQHDPRKPLMSYSRIFDGVDANLVARLRDYAELSGDRRSGGWEAYLHRSEDFIRFTAHLMIVEMLTMHGGEAKRRFVFKPRKHR